MKFNKEKINQAIYNWGNDFKADSVLEEKIINMAHHYLEFMKATGIPIDDESRDTPYRVAKMYLTEFASLYEKEIIEEPSLTTFENTNKYDEYVCVKDMPFVSICGHHHVPFIGTAQVIYHPDKKILGLSKFARVIEYFSKKPQIQEGMTNEVADYLFNLLAPKGLMIKISATHHCMVSRGVKAIGSYTITQAIRGELNRIEASQLLESKG